MAWWKRQLFGRKRSGFSLIELSMVLVAAGMVVGMGSQMMSSRTVTTTDSDAAIKKCYSDTSAALNTMNNALQQFFLRNGYYPLPAANNSTNGKQITMGSYGNVIVDNAGAPTIAIGRFPYATVGLTPQYAKDCFGNSGVKIASYATNDSYYRYIVSIDSASKTNYDANTTHGVVAINNTASASLNAKAIYAILSHGSTGCNGATSFGKAMNCATSGGNLTKVANPAFSRTIGDSNFFDDLLISFSTKGDGCGAGTVTWTGSGGVQCSYNSSSPLKPGTSISVSSSTALTTGSANLTCKNVSGSYVLSATGTCSCGTISNGTINPSGGVCTITCNGGYALSGGACMPIVNGACGGGPATCSAGNLINDNNSTSCNTTRTWSCQGSNTGSTANCTAANPACPINGACGSEGACSAGNVSGDNGLTACGTTRVWSCNGLNGGSNASCSNTHSACPVNGACGSAAVTCTAGTPINDNGQTACGNNRTWSCQGSNGGSTASCSLNNGACPTCNPSTVANGTVADYPGCSITCDAGYTLSGSSCVASSSCVNYMCSTGKRTASAHKPTDPTECDGAVPSPNPNHSCCNGMGCTASCGIQYKTIPNGSYTNFQCDITCNSGYTLSGGSCVAVVNGSCGSSVGTCTAGSLQGGVLSNSACPETNTWTCAGSNGGSNASCSATTACPSCSPSTVANGTVGAYPSCAITCNSGYTLSGNSCVPVPSCDSCTELLVNGSCVARCLDDFTIPYTHPRCDTHSGGGNACNTGVCQNQTATWGSGCSATISSLNNGSSTTVSNTASGYSGSATVQCSGTSIQVTSSNCAAVPLPMITCPTGASAQATPAEWPGMSSWEADGSKTTFACPTQTGGYTIYYNQYVDLTGGAPATPSCPSGGTVDVIRNRRVIVTRSTPLPTANSTTGMVYDGLYWSCTNYSGVCMSQASGTFHCS